MLSKADRLAFSAQIINADQQIAGLASATAQLQAIEAKDQALDTANSHLYNPTNSLINSYQAEFSAIDGNIRTSIIEQNIVDAAGHVLGNYFFPNSVLLTIPSLSSKNNVWVQVRPFALAFGVGKNYDQSYTIGPSEQGLITNALALITSASAYTDIQNTAGQHCVDGTCSLPQYDNQIDCVANSGIWTPGPESIVAFPAIQTLKSNLVATINGIVTQLNAELAAILTNDTDPTRQSQNNAAINDINTNILPALNAWLAYADFNTAHGQTTCIGFNTYNANLLAPTKLHSAQLSALSTALSNRTTFLSVRVPQLNTNLGSVSQNIDTGDYTGTGFYKSRLDFLNLRINVMAGSLTALVNDQQSINAQTQISSSLKDEKAIYMSILPTTKFAASGNGTAVI